MKALIINYILKVEPESDGGKDWSHSTWKAAASNLLAAARALQANPIPPLPPNR